jgi:carbamoyltransferase
MSEKSKNNSFLGLGKTLFNSSVCHLKLDSEMNLNPEIFLTERINRIKASGHWPTEALKMLRDKLNIDIIQIAENRDVITPFEYEAGLNSIFPFIDSIKNIKLDKYLSQSSEHITFVPHHYCHALSSSYCSPFQKSIIIVMDGAGSNSNSFIDFPEENFTGYKDSSLTESGLNNKKFTEECSIYLQDGPKLKCIYKNWQEFSQNKNGHYYSNGIGTAYEKVAELVFNNKQAAGKVMGLAAFQKGNIVSSQLSFLENLNWEVSYKDSSKESWEKSSDIDYYIQISSDIQATLEARYKNLINETLIRFPEYKNVILAGGCALNCTNNMKIIKSEKFEHVFVSPFPGDEGISLGCAFYHAKNAISNNWSPKKYTEQISYYGPKSSAPTKEEVFKVFDGYNIQTPANIYQFASELLLKNHIIAWFQGRSECGPRALGNRSLLCSINKPNAKDVLNSSIKFRESFRPYGCSCLLEHSQEYFDIPKDFENPFMSFACDINSNYKEKLKEVSHIDGTSRMQTVRREQNPPFYNLISAFGAQSGIYCLLNTSLNVMGEPIVETVRDAKDFLDKTNIHGLAIGQYYIMKKYE